MLFASKEYLEETSFRDDPDHPAEIIDDRKTADPLNAHQMHPMVG